MRSRTIALVLLASTLLALVPAHAQSPALAADAGFSQIAYDGAALHLAGRAMGGEAPYAYAWTASAGALSDAASATPDLATVGAPVGDITVTLTVTDALGAVATDNVRERVEATRLLADTTLTIPAGVPDEEAGVSEDAKRVFVIVPPGYGALDATLTWPDAGSTLQLDLVDTAGQVRASDHGGASPERAVATQPERGAWTAIVRPYLSSGTTAHLVVRALNTSAMPDAFIGQAPYWNGNHFGSADAQVMDAFPRGGTPPYVVAWDTADDGSYATVGTSATFQFPIGEHVARARITDAGGYRVALATPVTVEPNATTVKWGICGGLDVFQLWAMEFSATHGTCWIHDGHHTYFLGDHLYAFKGAHGYAFDVEQQFAPSAPDPDFVLDPLHRQLVMEVSVDGTHWTPVGYGQYGLAVPADSGSDSWERQKVFFEITGAGQPFRFLRVHDPLSLSQGLSGYLDHTQLRLEMDDLGAAPMTNETVAERALSCDHGDNMEAFFATHPCWFGGIDRYDATSFYETYFLGDGATLDRVRGSFLLLPFRDDDWFSNDTIPNAEVAAAYLQTSVDGRNWTTQATVLAGYGVTQAFDVALPHVDARFVRFFPQYHKNFDLENDPNCGCASEHHPKAYFVHTDVTVDGALPART